MLEILGKIKVVKSSIDGVEIDCEPEVFDKLYEKVREELTAEGKEVNADSVNQRVYDLLSNLENVDASI